MDLFRAESALDQPAVERVFLADWPSSNWDSVLEYTQTQMFSPGSMVLKAGSEDRALYIVAFGRLKVLVNRKKRLNRFKLVGAKKAAHIGIVEAGAVINELTFFDGKAGIATYQALSETQLIYLSYDAFNLFATLHPEMAREFLQDLGRLLALQIRDLTHLLSGYTE